VERSRASLSMSLLKATVLDSVCETAVVTADVNESAVVVTSCVSDCDTTGVTGSGSKTEVVSRVSVCDLIGVTGSGSKTEVVSLSGWTETGAVAAATSKSAALGMG